MNQQFYPYMGHFKRGFLLFMSIFWTGLTAQTLPEYLNFTADITKEVSIDYLLYIPDNYTPSEGKPLLLFLTGEEYLGDIDQLRSVGPCGQVESGMSFDYFIAAPQLPGDVLWDTEALLALIDHIQGSYHLDESQTWLTGLGDRGGWGAWELALLHHDRFNKFAPVASSPGTNVWQAHDLSIRIYHGAQDDIVPVEDAEVMFYELNWDDVDVELTIFDDLGHDIGDTVYSDPGFYTWVSGEEPSYGTGSPNPHYRSMTEEIGKSLDDDYLLYLPVGYDESIHDWPLLIYLHGSGSAIGDLDAIRDGGPPQRYEEGMDSDFILLCPQLHADVHWDVDRIDALVEETMNTYQVDRTRVYLTGLSRGGFGAWEYGVRYPNKFAAIIPISARDVAGVEKLASNTVWIFHGDQDTGVPWQGSQFAYNRLNALDADVHLTLYAGVGHWAWEPAYATAGLWVWMLSQQNETVTISQNANISPDQMQVAQNFPNPFNPSTRIQYNIAEPSLVSLQIFNINGQLIKTMKAQDQVAGSYTILWAGDTDFGDIAPAGVYFARIEAGLLSQTIKMTLLK